MKNHRRTRSRTKLKVALEAFSGRNQAVVAEGPSDQSRSTLVPATRATPRETIVSTWPLYGVPEVIIQEDGTVMRCPVVTVTIDEHSRTILGWHMS